MLTGGEGALSEGECQGVEPLRLDGSSISTGQAEIGDVTSGERRLCGIGE